MSEGENYGILGSVYRVFVSVIGVNGVLIVFRLRLFVFFLEFLEWFLFLEFLIFMISLIFDC